MDPFHLLVLVGAGLAAGFVAGLIGVGGGIIFAPVLFFHYQAIGIPSSVIAPLTIGSSLLCTLVAASISAWAQYGKRAVVTRVALSVGIFSALAVFLMTHLVTTQPWYDGAVFQMVFSVVLLVLVTRMVLQPDTEAEAAAERRYSWPLLAATGTVAGTVASAAGVGGGVVLVPTYSHFFGLPIHTATGTSSATIVIISLVGVVNYAWLGLAAPVPELSVGYVDPVRALTLALPSMLTAHLGVWTAHKINRRTLRLSFAALAGLVAARLMWDALG